MEETEEQSPLVYHCPECAKPVDVSEVTPYSKIECPYCGAFVRARTQMGQYQIVGLLGEGGMSQVFRGVDVNLGREVALKILHRSLSRDASLTSMFEREAKLTASIVHPNVVKVFTVGNDHGYFFIAMELVHAISLEQLIENKGALSEAEVLAIANDVTQGLMAAHGEDLIHRDIKPGNMLVTGEGTTKLVDFGLAVQQGGVDESEDLWATPFYVPPEKLAGEPDTFLGDIYSLGATLYHALAGRPPFAANTSSLDDLIEIKNKPVDLKSAAPGLSKTTIRLVEKMMAYHPADRFQSYEEVLAQIEDIRKRQFGIEAGGRIGSGKKRVRNAMVIGGISLAAILVLIAVVANREVPRDEGDLGAGPRERVISRGEETITGQFLSGRELLAAGEFRKAEAIFNELIAQESAPASIRIWSHFFGGTIHLFSGREKESREAFAKVLEITPESEESTAEALAFLKRASSGLADTLPLLEEDAAFSPESVEALGLLTAGLKNWQCGAFDSGVDFLRAFAGSNPPVEYEWIARLKGQVPPFLSDFEGLEQLPNPSAKDSIADLAGKESELNAAAAVFRTKGVVPALIKDRVRRIAAIRDLAAASAEPDPTSLSETMRANGTGLSTAGRQEIEQLKTLSETLQPLAVSFRFAEAITELETVPLETPEAKAVRDELIHGHRGAGDFIRDLAQALSSAGYEGVVRRREGIPLEAAITAADPATFVVDLGFGPNDVEVEAFAIDWLVEAAREVFPPVSNEAAGSWEKLVFFALVTGHGDLVAAIADDLAGVDPVFSRRWQQVELLR